MPPPSPSPPAAGDVFPLSRHSSQRYFLDGSGTPFALLGRTSWNIINLSSSELDFYLDNCREHGYTAIEMGMIWCEPRGSSAPFANGRTLLPFSSRLDGSSWDGSAGGVAPDFTRPIEAYWTHVDLILDKCMARSMVVFAFPAYVGFQGGSQGWMQPMVANGVTRMRAYGDFIGSRYRSRTNIVWMMGGDYGTPPNVFSSGEAAVEKALFDALLGTSGLVCRDVSAEWDSESIASSQAQFDVYQTINGAYSHAGQTATWMRRAYAESPIRPAFLVESAYDEEGPPNGAQWSPGNYYNDAATPPERRFIWRGLLNGIAGYIQGNGFTWPFNGGDWNDLSHLNSIGQQDLGRLNRFWTSLPWWRLVPDGLAGIGSLVPAGRGTVDGDDYVVAACTPEGDLLVAYASPQRASSFSVDLRKLRGAVTARWFDPTTEAYVAVTGSPFANNGVREFTPPVRNGSGFGDWVLRLDA